jgi:diguanylate cyclase (GGDEF)-like protein
VRSYTKDQHSDKRLAALMRVQADLMAWFTAAISVAFYAPARPLPAQPRSFSLWIRAAQIEKLLHPSQFEAMRTAALDLGARAREMQVTAQERGGTPTQNSFAAFNAAMETLREHMRGLTRICVLEDHGIDHLTGLYSPNAMHTAFKVEMDRLARRGQEICVALAQIDHYPLIAGHMGQAAERQAMRAVAAATTATLRVYDDAYRAGEGEFVLCLKQADIHAGTAAMDRLHAAVAREGLTFDLPDGRTVPLTLTSCLVAPLPGDTFEEILEALRHDLATARQEPGAVLTHHETSPLERFVSTQGGAD